MSLYEELTYVEMMKKSVIEAFGLESKKTVDFFFKADVLSFESLCDYFYALTKIPA